jgi:hypothetical protein
MLEDKMLRESHKATAHSIAPHPILDISVLVLKQTKQASNQYIFVATVFRTKQRIKVSITLVKVLPTLILRTV